MNPPLNNSAADQQFSQSFDALFRSGDYGVVATAEQYLCGLMQSGKRT
jgi:hypothetical protein